MSWWTRQPLRIIEICNAWDLNKISLAQEVKTVSRLGGNVQHFHCMTMSNENDSGGLNENGFFFSTSLAKKKNPDRLKEYLPLAHKKGIRVIVYFNVHWYSRKFGLSHPDWLQIREDGKSVDDVYTTGTSFCINSGYREWVFQILRDLCEYDIDGIFYDGPIFFPNSCYCETCRQLYREKTGRVLPKKSEMAHSEWPSLVEFQSESMSRFLADSVAIIKGKNPEILLYMNGNSNWAYWPTGRDNTKIISHTDMLGAEGGFLYGDLNEICIYKPGMTAKFLSSQSKGKPTVVFDCAGHKSWSWYLLPEAEIRMLLAETLAGGANYWLAVFPDDIKQPELKVIAEYGRLIKKNPEPFYQSQSMAKAALLWPNRGCNVYEGTSIPVTDFTKKIDARGVGELVGEFNGFYEALARSQVPFDVIDEDSLEDLSQYKVLILPNAPAFSSQAIKSIEKFVRNGGTLIADFETSLYDPSGKQRKDFALGDVLGVKYDQENFGPMNWDYVTSEAKVSDAIVKDFTRRKKYIPAPQYGIRVKTTTGNVLVFYCGRLSGCYEHTPEISSTPFMVSNRYGKGKVYYLAGTFGAAINKFRFREYLALVKAMVSQTVKPQIQIENSPWVEVSLREKGGVSYLHLINQTSGVKRPLTEIHSLKDVKIHSRMSVRSARSLQLEKKLKVTKEHDGVVFVLPRLDDYDVIELQQ